MDETPEKQCEKCGARLVLKPVPGAKSFLSSACRDSWDS